MTKESLGGLRIPPPKKNTPFVSTGGMPVAGSLVNSELQRVTGDMHPKGPFSITYMIPRITDLKTRDFEQSLERLVAT